MGTVSLLDGFSIGLALVDHLENRINPRLSALHFLKHSETSTTLKWNTLSLGTEQQRGKGYVLS